MSWNMVQVPRDTLVKLLELARKSGEGTSVIDGGDGHFRCADCKFQMPGNHAEDCSQARDYTGMSPLATFTLRLEGWLAHVDKRDRHL